jgi:copper chaperone CopZ
MNQTQTIEVPIAGMDCTECTQHVQHAIAGLTGVQKVDVFLSSEKAIIQLNPSLVKLTDIRQAVKGAEHRKLLMPRLVSSRDASSQSSGSPLAQSLF